MERINGILCRAIPMLATIAWLLVGPQAWGQTQTLRGKVIDAGTQKPLIGVTVKVIGTDPLQGTTTDENGVYSITDLAVGRYDISFTYVGYTSRIENGISITSGQETMLNLSLSESRYELGEVVVTSSQRTVLNEAALLSAKSFRVEELGRIPGGIDDPARMARKFAGVTPG